MNSNNEPYYRLPGREPHILSLMLLSAFAIMGAILMTPALPRIAEYFHTSVGTTQLTVTSFLLGYAVGQLIYGPIANRLGRKPAFLIGIGIATLGSLFSILSSPIESFDLLFIGRLLEALGASAGLVVCFTVINDFYFPQAARKVTSVLLLAFAVVPGVAVAVGGILTQYVNWQACFYFLLLYGLLLAYPAIRLPETIGQRDYKALHYQYLFKNYGKMLLNKKLIGFALCAGFSSACVYVFGAEGPFIGIHILHFAPAAYGLLGLTPFIGTLIGCLISIRLMSTQPTVLLKLAFLLELIASVIMLFAFIWHFVNIYTLLLPMSLLCAGHPILTSTALSMAMNQTEDKANGSAIMNFTAMTMPVIMTLLLGSLHVSAPWIMPAIFLISLLFMLMTYFLLLR